MYFAVHVCMGVFGDRQGLVNQLHDEDVLRRLEVLEIKLNHFLNWNVNPRLGFTADPSLCRESTNLAKYGCKRPACPGLYDQFICLDNFPMGNCIVYDYGIREQPEFGRVMSLPPFNCHVYAFDPSPVATAWMKSSPEAAILRRNKRYHLMGYGAGRVNGDIDLYEYDWGQVSMINYPAFVQGAGQYSYPSQKKFQLPVRTLSHAMQQLGHDHVDVVKLDVEGSEFGFLENAIDSGDCAKIDQLTLEWHHYTFDNRYGGASSPHINAIVAMLRRCGLHQYYVHDARGGWPQTGKMYYDMGMTLRYNLVAFVRPSVH